MKKPTVGAVPKKNSARDLLTKISSIDRIIFQKRYIEICLRNMRNLLGNAA